MEQTQTSGKETRIRTKINEIEEEKCQHGLIKPVAVLRKRLNK